MNRTPTQLICSLLLLLAITATEASPMVYPANAQSEEQRRLDEGACHVWASDETGVDPMTLTDTSTSGTTPQKRGGAVKGAVRGAALGAVLGDDSDDVRDAAKAGAAIGTVRQRRHNRRAAAADQQAQAEQAAAHEAGVEQYQRAYSACLEGRGYVVN